MTQELGNEWWETVEIRGRQVRHVSKFLRRDFSVSREHVQAQWGSWSPDEKLEFAAAFSARGELGDEDQSLLDFLADNGDQRIWSTIALQMAKHRDRNRALNFLLMRVAEGHRPLANYYQALGLLLMPQGVQALTNALLKDRQEVEMHPVLQTWGDRFFYLDYLSCSSALFKITGREEYRKTLKTMLEHPDEAIRKMVRMVASSSGIGL